MIIAVDFDGTIVEHKYPKIGREIPFAIDVLKRLQEEDFHQLILWTVREGQFLDDAVEFCRQRGLEFYAINSSISLNSDFETLHNQKIKADVFIDNSNLGGLPDWRIIYRMIKYGEVLDVAYDNSSKEFANMKKSNLIIYLKQKFKGHRIIL